MLRYVGLEGCCGLQTLFTGPSSRRTESAHAQRNCAPQLGLLDLAPNNRSLTPNRHCLGLSRQGRAGGGTAGSVERSTANDGGEHRGRRCFGAQPCPKQPFHVQVSWNGAVDNYIPTPFPTCHPAPSLNQRESTVHHAHFLGRCAQPPYALTVAVIAQNLQGSKVQRREASERGGSLRAGGLWAARTADVVGVR